MEMEDIKYSGGADYKKCKAPLNTVTRDVNKLSEETDNIYESVSIIGKRANQIAAELRGTQQEAVGVFNL